LDTNIIIDLLADVEAVKTKVADAEEAFAPSIAIGELYYGAEKSTRPEENVGRIEQFASVTTVLGRDTKPPANMARSKPASCQGTPDSGKRSLDRGGRQTARAHPGHA
jgi:predicted nucleic acid-binding protein